MTATVRVWRAFKRNLGNYQTADYGAEVTDEVQKGESLQQAYDRVRDFVDKNLQNDIDSDQ